MLKQTSTFLIGQSLPVKVDKLIKHLATKLRRIKQLKSITRNYPENH